MISSHTVLRIVNDSIVLYDPNIRPEQFYSIVRQCCEKAKSGFFPLNVNYNEMNKKTMLWNLIVEEETELLSETIGLTP